MRQNKSDGMLLSFAVSIMVILAPTSPAQWRQTSSTTKQKECETYSVWRVEWIGNSYTADWSIRRRIALDEGEVFSERDIERSIKNLNRWGHLKHLRREDITVTFRGNDSEPQGKRCLAKVVFRVKEKPSRNNN
jgi:outer membrane protein assembly factor BamA